MINIYWWGKKGGSRKIHWLGKNLCKSKMEWGVGFRDIEDFNTTRPTK